MRKLGIHWNWGILRGKKSWIFVVVVVGLLLDSRIPLGFHPFPSFFCPSRRTPKGFFHGSWSGSKNLVTWEYRAPKDWQVAFVPWWWFRVSTLFFRETFQLMKWQTLMMELFLGNGNFGVWWKSSYLGGVGRSQLVFQPTRVVGENRLVFFCVARNF